MPHETVSRTLISVIMKKLPNAFRLQFSRNMAEGKWENSLLLEEFSMELSSRNAVTF